jgi:hypothetical protein
MPSRAVALDPVDTRADRDLVNAALTDILASLLLLLLIAQAMGQVRARCDPQGDAGEGKAPLRQRFGKRRLSDDVSTRVSDEPTIGPLITKYRLQFSELRSVDPTPSLEAAAGTFLLPTPTPIPPTIPLLCDAKEVHFTCLRGRFLSGSLP